jgi:hypothetical protein
MCCLKKNVAEQVVDEMNFYIKDANIKYHLENISHITDARCNVGLDDEGRTADLKSKVHQGNSSVLNLVYMPRDQSGKTLGTCVVPVPGQDVATDIGSQDGCVVGDDTLPKDNGSDSTGSARGNPGGRNGHGGQSRNLLGRQVGQKRISPVTTTHEMGHWLGLEHVGGRGQSMQIPQEGGSSLFGRLSRAL